MISEHIEKLIHEGRAACRHYCTGGGSVWRIPVPVNRYIIITDIYFHPFLAVEGKHVSPETTNMRRNVQMFLSTSKKIAQLNFRINFRVHEDAVDPGFPIYEPGEVDHRETYLVFGETVKMNIFGNDVSPPNWTDLDFGGLVDDTDEPNIPIGFSTLSGTPVNTLKSYRLIPFAPPNAFTVNPLTNNINPLPPVSDQNLIEQHTGFPLQLNVIAPWNEWSGMSYPLTDIVYYEIFEPLPENLRHA